MALDASVRELDSEPLHSRAKFALRLFDELKADPAAFLALTFVDDSAAFHRALSCNCTNS